jgi:hypothetical protein
MAKKQKTVKKPRGKKPAGKRKTGTASASKTVKLTYGCEGGFCTASPKKAHLKKRGAHVQLSATNTNVTITFDQGKSPFTPNTPNIRLLQGQPQTFTVSATASGDYPYTLGCDGCPTPSDSPDMIVP